MSVRLPRPKYWYQLKSTTALEKSTVAFDRVVDGAISLLEQVLARFLCCCHLPVLILNLKVHIASSVNSLVEYILVAKMCYFFYYCEPAASAIQQREDQVST